jgi:hypothetical protein
MHIQVPPTEYAPEGIDVCSPIPEDMHRMLNNMPGLTEQAIPILQVEGLKIC